MRLPPVLPLGSFRTAYAAAPACLLLAVLAGPCGGAVALLPPGGIAPEQDATSDLFIGSVSGAYDASTGDFTLTGTASAFDLGAGTASDFLPFIAPTTITGLQIDASGGVVTPGAFTVFLAPSPPNAPPNIPGAITAAFTAGANLLEGTVVDVGFFGGELQMLVDITGGAAADAFSVPSATALAGLKLSGAGAGDFQSSFAFSGAVADLLGPVPEPVSAAVWALMFSLAAVRRRG